LNVAAHADLDQRQCITRRKVGIEATHDGDSIASS
jgi:hypothetical protein